MRREVARTYKYLTPLLISALKQVVRDSGLEARFLTMTVEVNSAHKRKTAILVVIDTGRYTEKWLFVASGNEESRPVSGNRLRRLYTTLERIAARIARNLGGLDHRFYLVAYSAPRFTQSFKDEAYRLYHSMPDTILLVRYGKNPYLVAKQLVARLKQQLARWLEARLEGLKRRLSELRITGGITEYYSTVKDIEIVIRRMLEALGGIEGGGIGIG